MEKEACLPIDNSLKSSALTKCKNWATMSLCLKRRKPKILNTREKEGFGIAVSLGHFLIGHPPTELDGIAGNLTQILLFFAA